MEVSAETRLPDGDEVAPGPVNGTGTTAQENKFQRAIASWRGRYLLNSESTVAHRVLRNQPDESTSDT